MIKVKVWIYLKKLIQLKVITLYANNENLILNKIVNEIFYLWSIEVRMMRTLYDQIIKLYVRLWSKWSEITNYIFRTWIKKFKYAINLISLITIEEFIKIK